MRKIDYLEDVLKGKLPPKPELEQLLGNDYEIATRPGKIEKEIARLEKLSSEPVEPLKETEAATAIKKSAGEAAKTIETLQGKIEGLPSEVALEKDYRLKRDPNAGEVLLEQIRYRYPRGELEIEKRYEEPIWSCLRS